MSIELIISPRSEAMRSELADSPSWVIYAAELRNFLEIVIEKSGSGLLEVNDLLVNQPLPDRYLHLRNGVSIESLEAVGLVEGMAAGRGPYLSLSMSAQLRIESGWDGAIHLFVTAAVATDVAEFRGREASLQRRDAIPVAVDVSRPVGAVADKSFWDAVQEASERVTLVCERWAHGDYGCRWFRVARENVEEVARLVRPRSLVCVVAEPDLQPSPELLEDDFTAFAAPLLPGELVYQPYPGGVDSLSDVVDEGYPFLLRDKVMADWCAVAPDPDGIVRAQWESPGES